MKKEIVRQEGLKRLKALQQKPMLKQQKENEISQVLFNSECWQKSKVIGLTKSMEFEFDTSIVLKQGWLQGKQMVMPKVIAGRRMSFHKILPETLFEKSSFGVEEPKDVPSIILEDIDLLIVPGVVFKKEGFRIGFGGGYYDRLLANFKGFSCSLVFTEQIQEEWQVDSFDLAVNKIFIR